MNYNFGSFGPDSPEWDAFNDIENELGLRTNFLGAFGGGSPQRQQNVESLYQPLFSRYLSQLGQEIMSGQQNRTSFTDYYRNPQNFNLQREMNRLPQQGRFAGPIRYF